MSVNKAIIIGRLGRDPESRTTNGGLAIVNFTMATTEKFKGEEKTEWHRVVAFGKLADICAQYLTKGSQVFVEGRIQTREWEDKDGVKRQTTEIVASEMRMLGGKQKDAPPAQGKQQGQQAGPQMPDDSDIPF